MSETVDVAAPAMTGKRLVGKEMVAKKYGAATRSILRWADAGVIPFGIKLGSRRLWDVDAIDAHIAAGCPRVRGIKGGRS